ncbi:MAG: ABC transporter substrate-binding protein [Deltaproteobacteria bacterium]|nr:ABC transporter substrate-binding protein [Deltaproteobacteria bacterium]
MKTPSGLLLWLCLAASLVLASPVGGAERVVVGMSTKGLYEFPTEVARKRSFYQDEGLDLIKVTMKPNLIIGALLAGEIDYSMVWGATLRAAVAGMPVRVFLGMYAKPLHMLIARPQFKKVEDLKGAKIAVSSVGSTPDVLLRATLRHFGINPEKDVQILSVGGSSTRLAALSAGSVDATPLDLAYVGKAERLGLSTLIYLGDVLDLPLSGIGTSTKKIRENPEQIRRLTRGTLKAIQYIRDNRADSLQMMVDYLQLPAGDAGKIYDFSVRSLSATGRFPDQSLITDVNLAKQSLKIDRDIPLSDVVNWSFVQEPKQSR